MRKRRWIGWILILSLVLSCTVTAYADENGEEDFAILSEDAEEEIILLPEDTEVEAAEPEESVVTQPAAANVVQEGTMYHVAWTLYDDGLLYIERAQNQTNGRMAEFGITPSKDMYTWDAYRDQIKSVILADNVDTIAGNAFKDCKNLTSVKITDTIYSSLSFIGQFAFQNCTALEEMSVPGILGTIEPFAFDGCSSLKSFDLYNTQVSSIGSYAFAYCSSLESMDLSKHCAEIGEGAFRNCTAMTSFTMPHTVYTIGPNAFTSCSKLKEITISDHVTVIDKSTFYSCSALETVVLPDGLTEIRDSAFNNCPVLTDLYIPDSVTVIGKSAFSGCQGLTEIIVPPSVKDIPQFAYSNCTGATKVILPDGLETIGSSALSFNKAEEIQVPISVSSIGGSAFSYCYQLKKINIPNLVKSLESNLFSCDYALEEVSLPDGLESIKYNAFYNCTALKELTIPGTVTSIAANAFEKSALTDIYFHGTRQAWDAFGLDLEGVTIHCDSFSVPIDVILSDEVLLYDGTPKTNGVTVSSGGNVLIQDTDYTVTYENNINAGKALVIITGIGNYSGQTERTFLIEALSLEDGGSVSSIAAQNYTGSAVKPSPDVYFGGFLLKKGTDYKLSYTNNKEIGLATVTVQGIGNYRSYLTRDFQIKAAPQDPDIKLSASKLVVGKTGAVSVAGMKESPTITYASSDKTVATVSSTGKITAKKIGTALITVKWAKTTHYKSGSLAVRLNVVPVATSSFKATNLSSGVKLSWKKVAGADGYAIYRDGTRVKKITKGDTVSWTDKDAAKNGKSFVYKIYAYATIDGTDYNSTQKKQLTAFYLSRPAMPTAKSSAKKLTISWSRNSKAKGYQIQYSKSNDFSSDVTKRTFTKNTILTYTATVKAGTYYIRYRSYKTIDGVNYYSAWSPVRSKKVN